MSRISNTYSFDRKPENSNEKSKKIRILVVDDDIDALFTLATVLQNAGYDVDKYESAKKALADYKEGLYDVLLLDVKMTEMSGFDLYQNIRKRDQKVRVCFLTAGETYFADFSTEFPELDDSNCAMKPIDNQELIARIRTIVES